MPAAAEAVPGLLPHLPVALEGLDSRMVDVFRARRGPDAVPGLPRGGGWLFAETAGETAAEAVAAARKLVADGACLDSAVITGPQAAALWRIREDGAGLGGRTPAGAPAWPGWEDSAVPPASLGPYLRELESLMAAHGVDGLLYGHFGDGCVHVRIDFPLRDRPQVLRSFTEEAAKLAASYGGSASGEHGDGRARGELLPLMYSAAAIGLMRGVKRLFDPGNLLNPGVIVDPAPLDADLRVPLALPLRRGLGFAYPHDAGDFTAAVHRCTGRRQVPGGHHRVRRRDVPVLPGHQGREGLHPGPRPGAAGAGQRVAGLRLGRARRRRGARPVPVLQGLLGRLPGRRRHGHLQGRGALPALPAAAAPRVALLPRLAAPLGGTDRAVPVAGPAGERVAARRRPSRRSPSGSAASTPGATCRGSRRRASAGGSRDVRRAARCVPASGAALPARPVPRGRSRKPVLLWVDTFTNAFAPQVGQAAVQGARGRGLRGPGHRPAGLLRPHLDLHRPARRRPRASFARRCARCGPPSTRASRSSASSRPAPPRCAATRRSCCRATSAPRPWPARSRPSPSC